MSDMSESLFQAIDTIVSKRLQAINFDNTDIYSITDASKADVGEYKVTDGSVIFTAYSTTTNYKENDVVYVTIPNNDFNQQKLIIGKYTAESETPFVFRNPTSTMIDVTGNIIDGEIPEAGLLANADNDGADNEHVPYPYNSQSEENEEEIIIWEKDFRSQNYIGFERLGIKADFKSWLGEFDCVQGHYGLKIKIYCLKNGTYSTTTHYELIRKKLNNTTDNTEIEKIIINAKIREEMNNPSATKAQILQYIDEKMEELYATYELVLDSDDMIGNPYNFVSYHQQEQVFDISERGQIIGMRLLFYQQPTTFKSISGEEIPHTNRFGFLLSKNLFTIDPYIMLGYDLDNFNGEQAMLTTTDSLTYRQSDGDEAVANGDTDYNKKIIHLSWLHKDKTGEITHILDDTPIDGTYKIQWYQWSAGAGSPDEWASVEWKDITPVNNNNQKKFHEFTYTFNIVDDSYNKEHELIKAIILFTSSTGTETAIHSNVIEFKNERAVLNQAIIDQSRGLSFKFLDNMEGFYYVYKQNYKLLDENQGRINRKLQCELYSEELETDGALQYAKCIIWRIPANNSMIYIDNFDYSGIGMKYTQEEILTANGVNSVDQLSEEQKARIGTSKEPEYYADISYETHKDDIINNYTDYLDVYGNKAPVGNKTTGLLYDIENKEIVITWYGNENNGYSINSILEYKIKDVYSQNNTNNTIGCQVTKDDRDYYGKAELYFGIGGTNGTNYTLVIEAYNESQEPGGHKKEQRDSALTAGLSEYKQKYFRAELYTSGPKFEKVDIFNNENFSKLKFEWKLGSSGLTKCYKKNTSVYNLYSYSPNTDLGVGNEQDYNLLAGNTYYKNTLPNTVRLEYKADINDFLYLELTVKGWGDYDLYTVFPIPIRAKEIDFGESGEGYTYQISHINGPREVCYLPDGYPEYMDNPYTLYVAEFDNETGLLSDNDIQVNSVIWKIYNPFNPFNGYTVEEVSLIVSQCNNAFNSNPDIYSSSSLTADGQHIINDILPIVMGTDYLHYLTVFFEYDIDGRALGFNHRRAVNAVLAAVKDYYIGRINHTDENYVLQPLDFYFPDATGYGVQAFYGINTVAWTQPIWIYQNDYGSSVLNKWNGKELQIDESNGTIISRGLAAGKKESDNSFTGVIIGDWSASGDVNPSMASGTGVYGLEHGAMAYAFKDNGTAFIGKSGKGRILFDGNNSIITSENYNAESGGGVYIDLDDGYQRFANNRRQYAPIEIKTEAEFNQFKSALYIKSGQNYNSVINQTYNEKADYYILANNYYVTINTKDDNLNYNNHALEIGMSNSPNFYVQWDGSLRATNADIQGYIYGSTIDINNGDFYVNEKGLTFMNNFSANYGTINNGNITALMKIKDGSILNGTLDATRGSIEQGNFYNPTIYGPNINLYFNATSYTQYSYDYVEVYNYDENVSTYYLRKSDVYGSAGSFDSFVSVTCTSPDVFNRQIELYGHIYVYQKTSTSSSSSGGAGQTSIKMYTGSGKDSPGKYIGFFGMAGASSDGGTAGIDLTGAASGVSYGIAFKSSGGNVISTDTSGHIYLTARENKTTTTASSLQLSSQTDENDVIIRGAKSKWALRFGTTDNDAPYINYNDSPTHYDLRYAYFA